MNIGKVNKILKEKFPLKEWENKVQDTRKQPVIPTSTIFELKTGRLKDKSKIWQAVGWLRERYPMVGRYYEVRKKEKEEYQELYFSKDEECLKKAQEMDVSYLLRTNKVNIDAEEIFRTYNLLFRIENVFKDLKGPVKTHPNRHHQSDLSETYIFQGILALHIMTAIEQRLKDSGDHRRWETIRKELGLLNSNSWYKWRDL